MTIRVVVTGARGLLGGAVARSIADHGIEVVAAQRNPSGIEHDLVTDALVDITDPQALREVVHGAHAVIHLAAKVDVVGAWDDYARVNITGTANVVDACKTAGVQRLVHISSPSVAHSGDSLVGAGAEPADPDSARGFYSRSKAQAERIVLRADCPSLRTVAIRPHLVWGPGDTQLVGRIIDRARAGRLALVGTGAALIDTTYVDNAADAIVAAMERIGSDDVHGRAFVVSNGQPRTVAEMVTRIAASAGLPGPRLSVPFPVAKTAGRVLERYLADPPITAFLAEQLATAHWFDQRETRRALRWKPRVSIDEGFALLAGCAT